MNQQNCLLGKNCNLAGTEECTRQCAMFIGLHGQSGDNGRVGFSRVPIEYKTKTVSSAPAREKQPEVFQFIDAYTQSFARFFKENPEPRDRIKNLYLWSSESGTGKSSSAACILNSFLAFYYIECLKQSLTPVQRPTYYLSMNSLQKDFLQMTRSGVPREVAEEAGERYYAAMGHAKNAELVVFDDVGTRSVTEAFRNDILDIIDHRQSRLKPCIFTSNLSLAELPELFGEQRLFDRIRDLCVEIEFKGNSQRGVRR